MGKSFFGESMEDLAAMAGMYAAIEASRDKNGKVDAAKATGLAMGLGHTSAGDVALLGAMLGAEGAFDGDTDDDFDGDEDGDELFSDVSTTRPRTGSASPRAPQGEGMTLSEYTKKQAQIRSEKNTTVAACVIVGVVFIALLLFFSLAYPAGMGLFLLFMLGIAVIAGREISIADEKAQKETDALESTYRTSAPEAPAAAAAAQTTATGKSEKTKARG